MAIYPGARWRPLPENSQQPRITPRQVIIHTAVDGANTVTLFDWFNGSSNLESHFYLQKSGGIEQYIDTNVRADANNKANSWAISIESWDGMASLPGTQYQPFNPAQLEALIQFLDWACRTHGIPRRLAPAYDAPGIGYHNQYPQWSPGATGCPGPVKAAQIRDVVIPRLQAMENGSPSAPAAPAGTISEKTMYKFTNVDGREEIISLNKDGRVLGTWENTPGGGFGSWAELKGGFNAGSIFAEKAADGRLCVTAADSMFGTLWGTWQSAPGQGPWVDWFKVNDLKAFFRSVK